jgi:hypothetical protein
MSVAATPLRFAPFMGDSMAYVKTLRKSGEGREACMAVES